MIIYSNLKFEKSNPHQDNQILRQASDSDENDDMMMMILISPHIWFQDIDDKTYPYCPIPQR